MTRNLYIRSCLFAFYDNIYCGKVSILQSCISTREKSAARKRMLSDETRIFKRKSASTVVNSRIGSAENGIPELGDQPESFTQNSVGEDTHRTNDKQREISDMDGRSTRRWEEHKKTEIHGRRNCLRNNDRKIRVMKKC